MSFYQLTVETAEILMKANLTAAQLRIWIYLVSLDPYGDRYVDIPDTLTIMEKCNVKKSTFYTAIARLQELDLYDFQDKGFAGRNLRGSSAVRKIKLDSKESTAIPKNQTGFQNFGKSFEELESQTTETSHSKGSGSLQTIQTNHTIQTLSEGENENLELENSEPDSTDSQSTSLSDSSKIVALHPDLSEDRHSDPTRAHFQNKPWRESNGELKADFWSFVASQMSSDKGMHPKLMAQRYIAKLERSGSEQDYKTLMTYLDCMNEPVEEWLDPESRKPYPWFVKMVMEDCYSSKPGNTYEGAAVEAVKRISDRKTAAPLWEQFGRRILREREEEQKAETEGRTYRPPTFMQDRPVASALPSGESKPVEAVPMPEEIRAKIAAQLKGKKLPALQAVREPVSQLEQMRQWIQDPVLQVEAIAWAKKEGYLIIYNDDGSVPTGIEELDF